MNINRNNYEDFFLLYADQELSPAEMAEVEMFVQENPDLANELEAFTSTRLPLEDLNFSFDKSFLYKSSDEGIRQENATEWFSKFVDGELNDKERVAIEQYVLQHPEQQPVFLEWQQTKIPQETIVCPRKADLYKKSTPTVAVFMKRYWAVAAMFVVLLGIYLITQTSTVNPNELPIVQQTKSTSPNGTSVEKQVPPTSNNELVIASNKQLNGSKRVEMKFASIDSKPTTSISEILNETRNEEVIAYNETEKVFNSETTFDIKTAGLSQVESKNVQTISARTDEPVNTNYTYKTLELEDDDKSMYVGPVEINKDKLRGFVRKAGGIFRSKVKNEGEDILNSFTSIAQPTLK